MQYGYRNEGDSILIIISRDGIGSGQGCIVELWRSVSWVWLRRCINIQNVLSEDILGRRVDIVKGLNFDEFFKDFFWEG